MGDEPVADDARGAVHVGQEELERPHPLGHPVGDPRPLRLGEDARDHVEREGALLAVEIERDPLVHEGSGQARGPGRHVLGPHLGQRRGDGDVGHPGLTVLPDHLVEGCLGEPARARAVAVEEVSHGSQRARHVFRGGFMAANNR